MNSKDGWKGNCHNIGLFRSRLLAYANLVKERSSLFSSLLLVLSDTAEAPLLYMSKIELGNAEEKDDTQ